MLVSISQSDWCNDLLSCLQPLWKEAILCDTTIECSQKNIIQAHSILLAAASPKLYSYFRVAEQGCYTIVTPDVPVYVWRNILSFIYHGRLELREEELVCTYNFARKIEMNSICSRLGEELKQRKLLLEDQQATGAAAESHIGSPRSQVTSPNNPSGSLPGHLNTHQLASPISSTPRMSPRQELKSDASGVNTQERRPSHESTPATAHPSQQQASVIPESAAQNIVPTERHECPGCLQNFNRRSALQKHASECSKLQQQQQPSGIVSYRNFYSRIEGTKGKETSAKFKCDLCGREYGAYQGLYMHLKSKHANEVQAIAATNNRHFRPGQLANRPGKGQFINKNTTCPECKKQFKTYQDMIMHRKSHNPVTTRRSSGSAAASSADPVVVDDKEGEVFMCHICGRDFRHKMHLGSHMRTHEKT